MKGDRRMMVTVDLTSIIVAVVAALGIPSAITGFCFRRLEKKIEKREKERDEKDNARRMNEIMLVECMNASIALGEATARAVQRIPDAKCNGDMHAALDYATEVKHKHKDFITQQSMNSLY